MDLFAGECALDSSFEFQTIQYLKKAWLDPAKLLNEKKNSIQVHSFKKDWIVSLGSIMQKENNNYEVVSYCLS